MSPEDRIPFVTFLGREKVPVSVAVAFLKQILPFAGQGLRPDQVFLLSDGSIQVEAGVPVPGYRAPENRGSPPREIEDVYVAGTFFYELLSGRRLGQLPEREILHGSALSRVLDELEDLSVELQMLLKAMLAFRAEARADVRLVQQELSQQKSEPSTIQKWMQQRSQWVATTSQAEVHAAPPEAPQKSMVSWVALLGMRGCLLVGGGAFLVGILGALWLWAYR